MHLMLLWTSLVTLSSTHACSRKHAANFIEIHFGREAEQKCLSHGEQCRFDRNCCAGLECRLDSDSGWGVLAVCRSRQVYEDYREPTDGPQWQDYQELDASQRELELGDLERRNAELRRRVSELARLRAGERTRERTAARAELKRRRLEALVALKAAREDEERAEVEAMRERERERALLDEERRQVNRTVSGRSRDLGLYMNMLSDLVDTDAINKRMIN